MNKFFSFLLFSILLVGCGEQPSVKEKTFKPEGTPAKGDMIISATIGEASNLIPFIATDAPSHAISGLIYESLLTYDEHLNLIPNIAKSWEISDDNLSITFHLRQDVIFSDDTPLTTEDVYATYQAVTNPKLATPYASPYLMIKTFEILGNYTFKVTYKTPFAPALSSWASLSILPKHKLEEAPLNTNSLKEKPVGTGPYVLEKWHRGKEIILKANSKYFKGRPHITARRIRLIPDMDTQFLELKAGNIDTMGLKPLQFTRLTHSPSFKARYSKYKYMSNGYTYMGYNLSHPLFKDKKVRQALSYAVNREALIQGVLMGQGQKIACPFKPGTWAYNTEIQPHAFNLLKAQKLLLDAGWKDTDNDGILDKIILGKKTPFSFTVVTNQGNAMRQTTAEILQKSFAKIGINMQIRVQEWSTFVENTLHKRNFEAFILGWSLSAEPDPYDIFHSSKQGSREFNIVGFENSEADEMIIKARSTFNQTERKRYLDRFQEIIHEEQPYMFLYAPDALLTMHSRVKGIKPAPAGIGYNLDEWYIPKEQQLRMLP